MAEKKTFKSILIVVAMIVCVFGGIFSLIQADYAKTPAGTDTWYWIGGILLAGFAITILVWFAGSGRRG